MNKVLILALIVIDATFALTISNSNNKFLVKNKNNNNEILTLNNVSDVYNSQVQPEMVSNKNY